MIRTQVYLTEREKSEIEAIAAVRGIKQSELIRQAVDDLIDGASMETKLETFRKVCGIWRDRDDPPDVRNLREGWSRRSER
jgi:hypothetical protein